MDRKKKVTFWCVGWLVGLLAVIACVIQCLMDRQIFCLCALVDGWMDGWMGGWVDGCCVNRCGEDAALWDGGFGCLVAWWVCWFGHVVAWLIGRLVGTPLMDAWMDGCCVNGEGAVPPPQCKPSLPRTGFLVSTAPGENMLWLLGWLVGLAALLLGWLVGWLVGWHSVDGWMHGWMDPALPHVPEAPGSVSGGSRCSGQSLRSFRGVPKG